VPDLSQLLKVLASLATTWAALLQSFTAALANCGVSEQLALATEVGRVLPTSAVGANYVMQMAALCLAQGRMLPSLQLAGAGQRLALAVVDAVEAAAPLLQRARQAAGQPRPVGSTTAANKKAGRQQKQQKQGQQQPVPTQSSPGGTRVEPELWALLMLLDGMNGLQRVKPRLASPTRGTREGTQPAEQQQGSSNSPPQQNQQVPGAGASCSAGVAVSAATASGSTHNASTTAANSSSRNTAGEGNGTPTIAVAAARLRQACRPRLQLVGCGNLGCACLSGPSAEGLVAGRKGVVCGGCRVTRYCSPACQEQDWAQHRQVCRRVAVVTRHGRVEGLVVAPPAK
jgi:hypothetical protein